MIQILLALFVCSPSSYAVDSDVEVVPKEGKEVLYESSSEFNRMDKQWTFGAQLVGVGPTYATSYGLTAGYFLNRNMIFFAEIMTGNLDSDSFLDSNYTSFSTINIDGRSIGAHFKHFVGNSFYYRAGLDLRFIEYKFSHSSGDQASFKGTSLGLTFNIGNQWQWKNFTLGCDWIGLTVPMSDNYKDEQLTTGGSSFYDPQDFEDDKDTLLGDTTLNVLRFYLGASF